MNCPDNVLGRNRLAQQLVKLLGKRIEVNHGGKSVSS
jgi:hypothetical protein